MVFFFQFKTYHHTGTCKSNFKTVQNLQMIVIAINLSLQVYLTSTNKPGKQIESTFRKKIEKNKKKQEMGKTCTKVCNSIYLYKKFFFKIFQTEKNNNSILNANTGTWLLI